MYPSGQITLNCRRRVTAVGINSANGWYPAGLDFFLCLPSGHVEPSEALWQAIKPSQVSCQRGRLEAAACPSSCVSAPIGEGCRGTLRPRLYVKRVQNFLSGLEIQIHFLHVKAGMTVIVTDTEGDWRMADVIWIDGGAWNPKDPTLFQVADVDTGVIN